MLFMVFLRWVFCLLAQLNGPLTSLMPQAPVGIGDLKFQFHLTEKLPLNVFKLYCAALKKAGCCGLSALSSGMFCANLVA
jgi:hypothetical protein